MQNPENQGGLLSAAAPANGLVDVDSIISKIQMPEDVKDIYEKAVIAGMRLMFEKGTHKRLLEYLDAPGELDEKIANGIFALVGLLWTKSNQTLPPKIIVPLTITMVCRAFEFLQKSGEPGISKEVLGSAMDKAVTGIMDKFGVPRDKLKQFIEQDRQLMQGAETVDTNSNGGM